MHNNPLDLISLEKGRKRYHGRCIGNDKLRYNLRFKDNNLSCNDNALRFNNSNLSDPCCQ